MAAYYGNSSEKMKKWDYTTVLVIDFTLSLGNVNEVFSVAGKNRVGRETENTHIITSSLKLKVLHVYFVTSF